MSKFQKLVDKLTPKYGREAATRIAASAGDRKYGVKGMAEKAAAARERNGSK